jgi:oxygen-independent coproporphyrinogen-3 oxidase
VAGLYIHIPFCRKRCHYCDFYKTTELGLKPRFLEMVAHEAVLQAGYLEGEILDTLYFGGGTPGLLAPDEIAFLLEKVAALYRVAPDAEVTLEANPDDVTPGQPAAWRAIGVNRLSMGIQSFHDDHLKAMNRRHTARQALDAVDTARKEGFTNISIDLIFGLPDMTLAQWEENLDTALSLPVSHISAYHLTWHEGTPFYEFLQKGILREASEEESLEQFRLLISKTAQAGFDHYEISNFARGGAYSRHNLGYWSGAKYLGLGPSAHSYNGLSRQWNVADLRIYLQALGEGKIPFESEELTLTDRLNDTLITRLRTKWGISTDLLRREFGEAVIAPVLASARPFLEEGTLIEEGGILRLSPAGIMVSDRIMAALMTV